MKKNLICKCLIKLGLLLFFTMLIPFTSYHVATAQAASIENEKAEYRLYLKSITLVKGKSFTLKASNLGENAKVSFKSDDQEVASVSDDGTITANKVGITIITATIKDGTSITPLTCDVTVGPPAFSVKLTKSRIILAKDKIDFLNVILKPSNTAEDAKYSSDNESIASISPAGRIKAKEMGLTYLKAWIDATTIDGTRKFSKSTVIVTSSTDAPLLETYFNEHPELNSIPEEDLTTALDKFFNIKYDENATTSQVNSLDRYLNDEFESILRTARDTAALSKIPLNQLEVISDSPAK